MARQMLPEERRRHILGLLEAGKTVRPADLVEELDVSVETIRRDLLVLERGGSVRRVYGGAMATGSSVRPSEPVRADRESLYLDEKQQIAELAAGLVAETDTVFLDVGTTAELAARALSPQFRGLVLTNSLPVAAALADRPQVEVQVAGGRMRHGELSLSGPDAEEVAAKFHVDLALLGSGGVHPEAGLTDYDLPEIAVRLLVMERAARTWVLADSTKLGRVALRTVCSWEPVDGIITDASAPPAAVAALEAAGVRVLKPPPPPGQPPAPAAG